MSIDPAVLPRHVAIIMDGNGRWAQEKGLPRIEGHRRGANAVHEVVRAAREIGVKALTLYAFSAQNWLRPPEEVTMLMRLLREYVIAERAEIMDNAIRLVTIGDVDRLPGLVREPLDGLVRDSVGNQAMTLCLALSYGGRESIVATTRALCDSVKCGALSPERRHRGALPVSHADRGPAPARPADSHLGGGSAVELLAVGIGLCGTVLHRHLLARVWSRRVRACPRIIPRTRAPLRPHGRAASASGVGSEGVDVKPDQKNLLVRIASALVALPVVGALVFWREPLGMAALCLVVAVLALREYTAMTMAGRPAAERAGVVVVGVGLYLALYFRPEMGALWFLAAIAGGGDVDAGARGRPPSRRGAALRRGIWRVLRRWTAGRVAPPAPQLWAGMGCAWPSRLPLPTIPEPTSLAGRLGGTRWRRRFRQERLSRALWADWRPA